jgi:hypothetical protein
MVFLKLEVAYFRCIAILELILPDVSAVLDLDKSGGQSMDATIAA